MRGAQSVPLFTFIEMEKIRNEKHFRELCDWVIQKDERFKPVLEEFGYPPFWFRSPNFTTLVLTILEQQVSLAAASAMFKRLQEFIGEITPENLLRLNDTALRKCGFSRQKIEYTKTMASEIAEKRLNLEKLNQVSEEEVRTTLIEIKGVGDWTIDMYVLMSLHFADIFPPGDLATIKAVYELKLVNPKSSKKEITQFMEKFSPYRSAATYLLWHFYLEKRNLSL